MHCPQCGQQQASGMVRFCSRCGFPLDGVIHLLANGGMLPAYPQTEDGKPEISPRKKGVRQGGILFLVGILLVPVLGVLSTFGNSEFLVMLTAIAALICFLGGPLRMLYAALFEEGGPTWNRIPPAYMQPTIQQHPSMHSRGPAALPPQTAKPATGWRQRPTTAELNRPPSVTENTTRLLEKDDPANQ